MFIPRKKKLIPSEKFCRQFFAVTFLIFFSKLLYFILRVSTQSDACNRYSLIFFQGKEILINVSTFMLINIGPLIRSLKVFKALETSTMQNERTKKEFFKCLFEKILSSSKAALIK